MANWRKQQSQSHQHHHQLGHWRSSSYSRKPPLDDRHSSVPSWEKKFCASVGSVPWGKVIESKKYMSIHHNVINWDDSAVKEAFDNAKSRFWAEINGLPCDISLPDPNIYIDDVDWDSTVDPELLLDLEREPNEERDKEVVILSSSLLTNQAFSCTGWGDAEPETPKPSDPNYAAQGWDSNLHENDGFNSWGQYCAPDDPAKGYEWQQSYQNSSPRWNQREKGRNNGVKSWERYCVPVEHAKEYEWQQKCQYSSPGWNQRENGRISGNGNWGKWDGFNRKRENNMSWNKNYAYSGNDNNEYQMNRGRRHNRGGGGGGRTGNFSYDRYFVDKVPTNNNAW